MAEPDGSGLAFSLLSLSIRRNSWSHAGQRMRLPISSREAFSDLLQFGQRVMTFMAVRRRGLAHPAPLGRACGRSDLNTIRYDTVLQRFVRRFCRSDRGECKPAQDGGPAGAGDA